MAPATATNPPSERRLRPPPQPPRKGASHLGHHDTRRITIERSPKSVSRSQRSAAGRQHPDVARSAIRQRHRQPLPIRREDRHEQSPVRNRGRAIRPRGASTSDGPFSGLALRISWSIHAADVDERIHEIQGGAVSRWNWSASVVTPHGNGLPSLYRRLLDTERVIDSPHRVHPAAIGRPVRTGTDRDELAEAVPVTIDEP